MLLISVLYLWKLVLKCKSVNRSKRKRCKVKIMAPCPIFIAWKTVQHDLSPKKIKRLYSCAFNTTAKHTPNSQILKILNFKLFRIRRYVRMRKCGHRLKIECYKLAYRCHASVLNKRSVTDEDQTIDNSEQPLEENESREKRALKIRRRRVRPNCRLCNSRCW